MGVEVVELSGGGADVCFHAVPRMYPAAAATQDPSEASPTRTAAASPRPAPDEYRLTDLHPFAADYLYATPREP